MAVGGSPETGLAMTKGTFWRGGSERWREGGVREGTKTREEATPTYCRALVIGGGLKDSIRTTVGRGHKWTSRSGNLEGGREEGGREGGREERGGRKGEREEG